MIVRATTAQAARQGGCGCAHGCESRCCEPECLVRPSFFCGQLLTDADLSALVAWSRGRFGLARQREGWGVVCGLDVTCSPPDGGAAACATGGGGPRVWIGRGYAVDCCGNDLVVCEPIAVDLGGVCKPPRDLCGQVPAAGGTSTRPPTGTRPPTSTPTGTRPPGDARPPTGTPAGTRPPDDSSAAPPQAEDGSITLDAIDHAMHTLGLGVEKPRLIAVDLSIRYGEDLTRGQRPMFRGDCSDAGPCEYTRVLERPTVCAELGDVECTCRPVDDGKAWRDRLLELDQQHRKRIDRAVAGPAPLAEYLREYPPYRLCFLTAFTSDVRQLPPQLGALLHLDWWLRQLACGCPTCRSDEGVPLGRIILVAPTAAGAQYQPWIVETGPRFRRPLRKDPCHPMPRGAIDLVPYLWQPVAVAQDELKAAGVVFETTITFAEVDKVLADPTLWFTRGKNPRCVIIKDLLDCARIVGFVGG